MVEKKMYPQQDHMRSEWFNLNGEWDFSLNEETYAQKIQVPFPWGSPKSGVKEKTGGTGYYRTSVSWTPQAECVFLVFGAVDYQCKIIVNDVVIGSHTGGYDRFEFDITDVYLRNGENVIKVIATDTDSRSQLMGKQSYGEIRGIWQTVWLEARPKAFIQNFFVKTKIDGQIIYEIETVGAKDGAIVSFPEFAGQAIVEKNQATMRFTVPNPKLWTPETPELYFGSLVLNQDGICDTVYTYFGIREIGTGVFGKGKNRYITLNGKPYFINGVLDQSYNLQGHFTLPSDEECENEILRLKKIGINMARIHIKAEEPLKLYYADKLGMLVMEDIPCFWADPQSDIMAQYEREMEAQIVRDRNHPSIFYWVVFNETWGLFTHYEDADGNQTRKYLLETAEWVVKCYHKAKALDPTRLVEDNSPNCRDHTMTDVNTWHFYSNGYGRVKERIDTFCQGAYIGSPENYYPGYTMGDVPCMNSECGNVWGVKGNAGESDISWQYRYMLNEFRLHDKLCGFVFTEFHDVVNEFNGYYKLDNSEKDFGYSEYGLSLNDLHAQDYVGADFPPMSTVTPGQVVTIPMFISSFTDERHNKELHLIITTLLHDLTGNREIDTVEKRICIEDYGCTMLDKLTFIAPDHDGIAEIHWELTDGEEHISANSILFDIDAPRDDVLSIEPRQFDHTGFLKVIPAIQGYKLSGIGKGEFTISVDTSTIPEYRNGTDIRLTFEASSREPMSHDLDNLEAEEKIDIQYMLGYTCDPGENKNSFKQTDQILYPGMLSVLIDDVVIMEKTLSDCPADSRGMLSHHYQPVSDQLDEAGSYGELVEVVIPGHLIGEKNKFCLTIRSDTDAGLSVFGRRAGRYGIGVVLSGKNNR